MANHSRVDVIDRLLWIARRQYKMLLAGLGVGVFLGFAYLVEAVPKYTASTQLLIDAKRNSSLDLTGASPLADLSLDTSAVESQVEILKSKRVAYTVIDDLNLGADESSDGFFKRLLGLSAETRELVSENEKKEKEREDVVRSLERNLTITRIGRSYVLEIAFTSTTPNEAAAIANAFAKAYINGEVEAIYEESRRSSDWLLSSVQELKKKSIESDFAVQRFKSEKGLISTSQNGSAVLVSEQQLAQINTQLISARADTVEARVKYELINEIIAKGEVDAAVSESLANPVIVELRNKYLAASKSEADLSARFGRDHEQAIKLREEMKELVRLIFDELRRIAESYKSELDIATERERSLDQALAGQVGVSGNTNEELVTLRELTREADTYRNLYQNMLQLYQESLHKQSLPVSDTRVITTAEPPSAPSSPKPFQTIAISLIFGSLLGGGLALVREVRDRSFRTAAQVSYLGLRFLGMLPIVTQHQLEKIGGLPPGGDGSSALMRYSFRAPLSRFTETLSATRVALDLTLGEKKPKVIGVVSVLSGEGKSTVSKNLASLVACMGIKTLLIDGDFRNPTMTRELAPNSEAGILDVLSGRRSLNDVLLTEAVTHLSILPGAVERNVTHTKELFASAAMERLLFEAGGDFEYIIVDLPPLGPVVDARIAAAYFDSFVLVIGWGNTPQDVVYSALEQEKEIRAKCVGVILNKVDKKRQALYHYYTWEDCYERTYYKDDAQVASSVSPMWPQITETRRRLGKFFGMPGREKSRSGAREGVEQAFDRRPRS